MILMYKMPAVLYYLHATYKLNKPTRQFFLQR